MLSNNGRQLFVCLFVFVFVLFFCATPVTNSVEPCLNHAPSLHYQRKLNRFTHGTPWITCWINQTNKTSLRIQVKCSVLKSFKLKANSSLFVCLFFLRYGIVLSKVSTSVIVRQLQEYLQKWRQRFVKNGFFNKTQFLSKSPKFRAVLTIRFCSNFTSMRYKHILRNVYRDFWFPMPALATVAGKSFNGKFTAKIDFPIEYLILPLSMLTLGV